MIPALVSPGLIIAMSLTQGEPDVLVRAGPGGDPPGVAAPRPDREFGDVDGRSRRDSSVSRDGLRRRHVAKGPRCFLRSTQADAACELRRFAWSLFIAASLFPEQSVTLVLALVGRLTRDARCRAERRQDATSSDQARFPWDREGPCFAVPGGSLFRRELFAFRLTNPYTPLTSSGCRVWKGPSDGEQWMQKENTALDRCSRKPFRFATSSLVTHGCHRPEQPLLRASWQVRMIAIAVPRRSEDW